MFAKNNALNGVLQDKFNPNNPKITILLSVSSRYLFGLSAPKAACAAKTRQREGFTARRFLRQPCAVSCPAAQGGIRIGRLCGRSLRCDCPSGSEWRASAAGRLRPARSDRPPIFPTSPGLMVARDTPTAATKQKAELFNRTIRLENKVPLLKGGLSALGGASRLFKPDWPNRPVATPCHPYTQKSRTAIANSPA